MTAEPVRQALLALIMFSVVEHNSWNNWGNLPARVGGSGVGGEGEVAVKEGWQHRSSSAVVRGISAASRSQQLSGMFVPGGSGAALGKVHHHRLGLPEAHLPLSDMGLLYTV